MASLSGKNLSCLRGDRLIFQGLSFAVQQGQTLILTGANGSGKTSLLRLMAGLLDPFAGEIKRDGNILWLGQETPLKPQLTVLENLQFLSCAAGDGVDGKNRPVTELRFPRKRESLFSWALRSPLSRG
ncbi:MAG TPA: hypothetical protein DEA55_06785, partial [Rhodospirillaceae bacterium]|nr:hypothetical protein [Rhodospirillaceae bacterium]